MSNLSIYISPIALLWSHYAQHLVCVELILVLLLLLRLFCDFTAIALPLYNFRILLQRTSGLRNKYVLMYFIRRKRDSYRDLIFIVNIRGAEVEVKKIKL